MANIKDKITQIRQAIYGKEIRESIASGIESINTEVESTTERQRQVETRQTNLENTFNAEIENAISENPSSAETVAARTDNINNKTYQNLGDRLDDTASQLADIAINVKNFGAKGDCVYGGTFESIPTGTDDTLAIQNAINYCKTMRGRLIFEPNKKYLITDTLIIDSPIDIEGNFATIVAKITDKTKPVILCKGQARRRWSNFYIGGCGYLPLAGIQLSAPDNQAMELYNIKVVTCRHGIYVNEAECINRIRFVNCDFTSNLLWGVYIKSFDVNYAHSAPIFFHDTILNGNGIPTWMDGTTSYDGTVVLNDTDKYGGQIYVKGFGNLFYLGGQIDCHGSAKNIALALFEKGAGLTMIGTDIEDIATPVKTDGSIITDFTQSYAYNEGGAVTISNVEAVNIQPNHTFGINTKSLIKLSYNCEDVNIAPLNIYKGDSVIYSVEVYGANNYIGSNAGIINLTYNGDISKLNDLALVSIDKSKMNVLTNISGGLQPNNGLDYIFDKSQNNGNQYTIGYWGDSANPDFVTNGCYIEKEVNNADFIFAILECTQNTYYPDGRFFIEALDGSNVRLGYKTIGAKAIGVFNSKKYKWVKYMLPTGTYKVRYGFINSANYTGTIDSHARVSGFTVYSYHSQPTSRNITLENNFNSQIQALTFNKNTAYGIEIPTSGIYKKGFRIINTNPTVGQAKSWVCTTSGEPGVWVSEGNL